jgi:peptidoglycan/LPS O-acetylase OafA/YrhL
MQLAPPSRRRAGVLVLKGIPLMPPTTAESRRLQTLRGVACILLVAFHTVGNHPWTGLHVADDSAYRFFANLFQYIRMPLFTFLSGFVYAYRPVVPGGAVALARRKLTRLLLPLLCVSTLYFAATVLAPADSNGVIPLDQIWRIYVFPYVHYWFLQAIILLFVLVAVLDRWQLLATPARYAVALGACIAVHLAVDMKRADDVPFGIFYAAHFAPYFLLGVGANRFRSFFLQPRVSWTCLSLLLVTMALHATILLGGAQLDRNGSLLEVTIAATATLTMVRLFPAFRPLEIIGAYSFSIYLFHSFFVAGIRVASKQVEMLAVVFVACVIAGIVGPIVLERVLGNVPIVKTLLFGKGFRARRPALANDTAAPVTTQLSP